MTSTTETLSLPPWKGDRLPETGQCVYAGVSELITGGVDHFSYKGVHGRLWKGSVNSVVERLWPDMKRPEGAREDTSEVAKVRRAINAYLKSALAMVCIQQSSPESSWWVRSEWTPRGGDGSLSSLRGEALTEKARQLAATSEPQKLIPGLRPATMEDLGLEPIVIEPSAAAVNPADLDLQQGYEDIDPRLAAYYLERDACVRPIDQITVSSMARDMVTGRWRLTHQGIAFDPEGWLIDGQHRLTAIVKAEKVIRLSVTRGLPRDVFEMLDTGRARTLTDTFRVNHSPNAARELAAVARRVALWNMGKPYTRSIRPTKSEIMAVLDADPSIMSAGDFAFTWRSGRVLAGSLAGFSWWLFNGVSPDHCQEFLGQVALGVNLGERDPAYILRERLIKQKGKGKGYVRPEVTVALVILAWNQYRKGKQSSRLVLPETLNDASFPQPI
jgi:hypothetical protein